MKSGTLTCITTTTLLAALAVPIQLTAQHNRYKLVDLGTFGGPNSYLETDNGENGAPNQVVNSRGVVAGWADTPAPDPYAPNCLNPYQDCFLPDAFQWQNGAPGRPRCASRGRCQHRRLDQ